MVYALIFLALYFAAVGYVTYGVGPFHYRYSRPVAWLLKKMGMLFITIGAMCFKDHPLRVPTPEQDKHERHHNHQWRVRPFFAPVYLFWLCIRGYGGHDDENDARREAGQKER